VWLFFRAEAIDVKHSDKQLRNEARRSVGSTVQHSPDRAQCINHLKYWDEPFLLGCSGSTARRGLGLMRDAVGNDTKTHWGSAHPGGANFLFGDGSVRTIRYELSWIEFTKLLTPRAGDVPRTLD
jgi:prepilin-type processing-associated H-X9-DG protein